MHKHCFTVLTFKPIYIVIYTYILYYNVKMFYFQFCLFKYVISYFIGDYTLTIHVHYISLI